MTASIDVDTTGLLPVDRVTGYGASEHATSPVQSSFRLLCVVGPKLGTSYRLGLGEVVIGRGMVTVRLDSADVSRAHARVWFEQDGFVVEDLGSANGTLVNGRYVDGPTALRLGDRLQLGSTILVFTHHDDLESRMHQLLRLEAMGVAVSALAHDFNNALQVIAGGIDELECDLPPRSKPALNDVRVAAEAAASLARRLINIGCSEPPETEVVFLVPLTSEVIAMARRVIGTLVRFHVNIAPGAAIQASREELQQILLNLCLNARDAMPEGGTLSISARCVPHDKMATVVHQLAVSREYVELVVTDTGIGMDEATLARAFEPFFTTKAPGKGTGLGLAMIHAVVRRHGGVVQVESAPGRGTTFRIVFPSADDLPNIGAIPCRAAQ